MKCNHCGAEMDFEDLITRSSLGREVKWVCPQCGNVQHQFVEDALKDNTQQGKLVVKDEWFDFRCVAAKDLLGSIVANPSCNPNVPDKNLVTAAINLTDELIKQLRGEK